FYSSVDFDEMSFLTEAAKHYPKIMKTKGGPKAERDWARTVPPLPATRKFSPAPLIEVWEEPNGFVRAAIMLFEGRPDQYNYQWPTKPSFYEVESAVVELLYAAGPSFSGPTKIGMILGSLVHLLDAKGLIRH